jgi:hypothetical protein
MIAWIKGLFSSGDTIKKTLNGVGDLAKDIKTIVTGKVDTETLLELEKKFAELDNAIAQHQATVVSAEAQGSWLQRNWRPITMLIFLLLVILNQFKLLTIPLSDEIWGLFKIGLGGYIGGRSLEKVVSTLKK